MIVEGSSPRGRGKPRSYSGEDRPAGLIPAWAGKTVPPTLIRLDARAHPRVGGENFSMLSTSSHPLGSSPRGRGKHLLVGGALAVGGLIPAWAGKTWPPPSQSGTRRAHPRVGGENRVACLPSLATTGSSPRGRGKLEEGELSALITRLIPAWAGKTPPRAARWQGMRAHPRVGGENRTTCRSTGQASGSSPRGRGKPCV